MCMGNKMDNKEISSALIRIESKIDFMGQELNKSIVQNSVQEEKISSLDRELTEVKNKDMPQQAKEIKSSIKYWVIAVAVPTILGFGISIANFIKG